MNLENKIVLSPDDAEMLKIKKEERRNRMLEKKKERKANRKATEKMMMYANTIAEKLGVTLEEDGFAYIHEFISENKNYDSYQGSLNICADKIPNKRTLEMTFEEDENFINNIKRFDKKMGVYFLWSNDELVYIGKSTNLSSRIYSSFVERSSSDVIIDSFSVVESPTVSDMHILEVILITENEPFLNKEFQTTDTSTMFKSKIVPTKLERIPILKISEELVIKDNDFCENPIHSFVSDMYGLDFKHSLVFSYLYDCYTKLNQKEYLLLDMDRKFEFEDKEFIHILQVLEQKGLLVFKKVTKPVISENYSSRRVVIIIEILMNK